MADNALTQGAVLVAALVARVGASAMARRLKLTEGGVRAHGRGAALPRASLRRRYEKLYDVPASAWELPAPPAPATPGNPPGPPARAQGAGVVAPTPTGDGAVADVALAVCLDTVARLRRELDRLDTDPAGTARERASIANSLTSSTRLLGRLSGSLELTTSAVLRSAPWREVKTALLDALAPVPGALEAMAGALERLEGQ